MRQTASCKQNACYTTQRAVSAVHTHGLPAPSSAGQSHMDVLHGPTRCVSSRSALRTRNVGDAQLVGAWWPSRVALSSAAAASPSRHSLEPLGRKYVLGGLLFSYTPHLCAGIRVLPRPPSPPRSGGESRCPPPLAPSSESLVSQQDLVWPRPAGGGDAAAGAALGGSSSPSAPASAVFPGT